MNRNFAIRRLFILCMAMSAGYAAQSEPDATVFAIAGKVVNSVTGEPIRRALVAISGGTAPRSRYSLFVPEAPAPYRKQVLTDEAGGFRFGDLTAGSYTVLASKPQFEYESSASGPFSQFSVGPSREDIEMRLAPLATLEGTAVDGDGNPLPGVNIQALDSRVVEGRREVNTSRSVATDDRGQYRLWGLRPGKYYVKAAGRSGGTRLYLGERAPTFDSHECFTPVYYGGGPNFSSATPLQLKAGQHARADFTLAMQPAFKIRGSLANFTQYLAVQFELLSGAEDVSAHRVSLNSSQGRFEVQDVVPGTYRLRATQGQADRQMRGETEIRVSASDLSDVILQLVPGVDVSGNVRCETPPSSEMQDGCFVYVRLAGPSRAQSYGSEPGENQQHFTVRRVLAGEYRIDLTTPQGYVSSLMAGGVDLLATRKLTVQPGVAPPPIEIAIRLDGGAIAGTLEKEKRTAETSVLLVPDSPAGTPLSITATGDRGEFQFSALAPGDYTLYALVNPGDVEYANPEIVRTFGAGKKVRVRAAGREQVTLTDVVQ